MCYPWGEPSTALEHFHGPDEMQRLVIGQQDTSVVFETTDLRPNVIGRKPRTVVPARAVNFKLHNRLPHSAERLRISIEPTANPRTRHGELKSTLIVRVFIHLGKK